MMEGECGAPTCSRGTMWNGKPVALKRALSSATVCRLSSRDCPTAAPSEDRDKQPAESFTPLRVSLPAVYRTSQRSPAHQVTNINNRNRQQESPVPKRHVFGLWQEAGKPAETAQTTFRKKMRRWQEVIYHQWRRFQAWIVTSCGHFGSVPVRKEVLLSGCGLVFWWSHKFCL